MKFMLPVLEFKNMKAPSPYETDWKIKRCICYAAISNIPEHLRDYVIPDIPVPAEPSVEKITSMLHNTPRFFHLYAPTITIHASSFVFDNRKNKLFFELPDLSTDGIILGQNTIAAVLENRLPYSANTPDGEVYVELEMLKGLNRSEIDKLAMMRSLD